MKGWQMFLYRIFPALGDVYGDRKAQAAYAALDRDDYLTAALALEEALQVGAPHYDRVELYILLGKSYRYLRRIGAAFQACQRAIDLDARAYKAWNSLGVTHFEAGNLAEAERCHLEALRLNPDYAFAHASLGAIYVHQNEPEKAIAILQDAIRRNPSVSTAYSNLALAYAMVGRYYDAQAALRHAITLGYQDWREVQNRIAALQQAAEFSPIKDNPHSAAGQVWYSNN